MKTAVRIMVIIAVIVGALSVGAARAAKPLAAGGGGRKLQFELVDGTVITGRIDVKTITFKTSNGNVLKIPVADMRELSVGLNDRPGFVRRIDALVKAMDLPKTRRGTQLELIAFGPAVAPIVKRHSVGKASPRLTAVKETLGAYTSWPYYHPDAPKGMALPLQPRSKIRAGESVFVGTVNIKQFQIASPYGPATAKLDDVHRICPAVGATRGKFVRLTVELRDKTHIRGIVINKSLGVKSRYGTMVVPFVRIQNATFAAAAGQATGVQCWGSDRVVGTFDPSTTISLETNKGRADLSAGKIAVLAYGLVTLRGHSSDVYTVAFSPDGKRLASGACDRTIKLWDTAGGKQLLTLKGHSKLVISVAFSPDGKRLASGSWDKTIKLWDTAGGKELLTLRGHSDRVGSVAFSPDGKRLASGGADNTLKLWDTAAGKELSTPKRDSFAVNSVAFSPDGKRLALGSIHDGTVSIRDTAGKKELLRLRGHSNGVFFVAFSPDGKRLASASSDRTIKLWDIVTGKKLLTLKGHSDLVWSVAFSPDGKRLASGSIDRTVRVWDTATGKELLRLKGHLRGVRSVAFSPDGKRLASGSADKTIKLWDALEWTKSAK